MLEIDLEFTGHEYRRRALRRSRGVAQRNADPGQQLVDTEWLGQVVIGAEVQCLDFVTFGAAH